MRKPDRKFNAFAGYHQFRNEDGEAFGSFEVYWHKGDVRPGDEELAGDDFEPARPGWYWHACFPGCMPDGGSSGPFTSSRAAWRDARNT